MVVHHKQAPADDDIDILEKIDNEDQEEEIEGAPIPEEEVATADVAEEEAIVKEIEAVAADVVVPEETTGDAPVKAKPHMISQELIDRELAADDLFDEGAL